jgi:hypothetical protein
MLAGYSPFYDDNPLCIYENITSSQLEIPSTLDTDAADLIS